VIAHGNFDDRLGRRRREPGRLSRTGGRHLAPQRDQGTGITRPGVPHLDGCHHSDLLVRSTPEVNVTGYTLVLAQQ
jgi:hypothetical protein